MSDGMRYRDMARAGDEHELELSGALLWSGYREIWAAMRTWMAVEDCLESGTPIRLQDLTGGHLFTAIKVEVAM